MTAQGKFYFLENRDFALGDLSRELAQLKEAAPIEWRREGMSAAPSVASQVPVPLLTPYIASLFPSLSAAWSPGLVALLAQHPWAAAGF